MFGKNKKNNSSVKKASSAAKKISAGGRQQLFPLDKPFLVTIVILLAFGLLMIMSAGVSYGQVRFDDSYYFFKQQILGLIVGGGVMYITANIDYHLWRRLVMPIFGIAVVLLIMVFIPGIGVNVYGATRWIELGPIMFQPSEVMKLAIILYLAAWLSEKGEHKVADFNEGLVPFLGILLLIGFLIIKQPDTGTLGVICLMAMSIFFTAGAQIKHLLSLIGIGFASLAVLIVMAPYRLARLTVFLNPDHDSSGSGYQVSQALLAVGSGGLFGAGLGQSRQKFNYLPEPVTDSIFAVIGEEFGFIGAVLLISLFLYLAWRGLRIAQGAPDMFGRLIVVGVVAWILFQSFINISAIIGLIPLTGIPLPLISYGGTSLAVILAAVGIVLNVSRQSRIQKL